MFLDHFSKVAFVDLDSMEVEWFFPPITFLFILLTFGDLDCLSEIAINIFDSPLTLTVIYLDGQPHGFVIVIHHFVITVLYYWSTLLLHQQCFKLFYHHSTLLQYFSIAAALNFYSTSLYCHNALLLLWSPIESLYLHSEVL